MESEKVEEKAPTEQTQPQTSTEAPSTTEPKKETPELTQDKKDSCKIIFFLIFKKNNSDSKNIRSIH